MAWQFKQGLPKLKIPVLSEGRWVDDTGNKAIMEFLSVRFKIEREKFDRSGVYAYTQRLLAYNSNKIEGSW